ncbi:DUF987 domain-containing protein [Escherichia coli]|nr:DUF987 domain-containing protein [Escherichia coli]
MKIITRGEAMRIHQQHPASRLFPFCTGKYRWHGSAGAYTGREVQDIPGAYFHERRSLNNFHRDRVITFEQIAE